MGKARCQYPSSSHYSHDMGGCISKAAATEPTFPQAVPDSHPLTPDHQQPSGHTTSAEHPACTPLAQTPSPDRSLPFREDAKDDLHLDDQPPDVTRGKETNPDIQSNIVSPTPSSNIPAVGPGNDVSGMHAVAPAVVATNGKEGHASHSRGEAGETRTNPSDVEATLKPNIEGAATLDELKNEMTSISSAPQIATASDTSTLCQLCLGGPFGAQFWFFNALKAPQEWQSEMRTYAPTIAEREVVEQRNPSYVYVTTRAELETSAGLGCPSCEGILSQLPAGKGRKGRKKGNRDPPAIRIRLNVSLSASNHTPAGLQKLRLFVMSVNGQDIRETRISEFHLHAEPGDPAATVVVARPVIRDIQSPEAITGALKCITDCQQNHERCRIGSTSMPSLPTRVVDCIDPKHPKLVITNKERAIYATLSYCWGEAQPHQTTTANLASYLAGIDMGQLPQTIKDAIATTHALGIRYIWIDSLCIIQDSIDDKVNELAQMARIYMDAYVTIIAASAEKVSEGFLQVRKPSDPRRADVPIRFLCPDGLGVGCVYLSSSGSRSPEQEVSEEPVAQRAWCFQEHLLSKRALVYGSQTLEYHCLTSMVAVGGSPLLFIPAQRLPDTLFASDTNTPNYLTPHELTNLRRVWKETVVQYMRRGITNPADKLVALASVAERFHRGFKSRYLAGLWETTLIADLCWFVFNGGTTRPSSYRAPSWSWAAVDHGITIERFTSPETYDACDVVSCTVTLKHEILPFGEVSSGTLVLRAPLFKAYRDWAGPPWADVFLPGYDNGTSPEDPRSEMLSKGMPHQEYIADAISDCFMENNMKDIYIAPLRWNIAAGYAEGLVLTPVVEEFHTAEELPLRFRRLGYFHSDKHSKWVETSILTRFDVV